VLGRVRGAFLVLAILAAGAGALGVLAAMTSAVIDRRREIGLLKALGATDGGVAALMLTEAAILGVVGGILGFGIGFGAARAIGAAVFASPPPVPPALGLLALLVAVAVALVGTAWPLRAAVRLEPHRVLHEA
jgi:putative ABC transport system permease protein